METRAIYSRNPQELVTIRPETLKPATSGWLTPTPAEIRQAISLAGLTQFSTGQFLGLAVQPATGRSGNTCRTVRRWLKGETTIPYPAWALLCNAAGFGQIWS